MGRHWHPSRTVLCAGLATVVGMALGTGALPGAWLDSGASPSPLWLAVGCALVWVAELARVRARIGPTAVDLTWRESAFVVLCYLLPAGWVPAAVMVGACGAYTSLGLFDRRRSTGTILRSTAILTLAATAGVLVTRAVAQTYGQPLDARGVGAILAGALVSAVISMGLIARDLVSAGEMTGRGVVPQLLWGMVQAKVPMLLGNITIGLLAITVDSSGRRWLVVLLPPVAWLLQQAYGYRLRLDDERWTWRLFSEVTAHLNQLDERDTAIAGIRGALRLFPAMSVDVVVGGADDSGRRTYTGRPHGQVGEVPCGGEVADTGELTGTRAGEPGRPAPGSVSVSGPGLLPAGLGPAGWGRSLPVESRPLLVGGQRIGEIRIRLATPVGFRHRHRHMLAAYADALAAALHDAATHDEMRVIEARGRFEAVHDPLTGLANRTALLATGDALISRKPDTAGIALLVFDVDHFKEVNNALGHAAGDQLLRMLADRLRSAMGGNQVLARLGGDEFAILLTSGTDGDTDGGADGGAEADRVRTESLACADRLIEVVAAPLSLQGVVLSVEVSVGVAATVAREADMTELLRRADIAMYQAKRGPGKVCWYQRVQDDASIDRLALLADARTALSGSDQLVLYAQPVVALDSGRPVGAEILIRWEHPRRGLLAPADFLDAIEHSELVGPFTRYVLDRSLALAASWQGLGLTVPISVNISARSLFDRSLAVDLPKLLEKHGVPPERLTLEISESVVVTESAVVEQVLAGVREAGVRLAVDDFGSGFSSLTFLTRVQVDEVKIDRAFVGRMVDTAEAAAIVRTTVDLGVRLGLSVVAEGVETSAQRAALRALGCVTAQGFYFHRPMPSAEATRVFAGAAAENP